MRYPIIPSYMKCNDFKQEPTKCLDIRQTSNCWCRIHICMFMLAHNQIQSQNCVRYSGSICLHAWIFLLYIIIWIWFLFCFSLNYHRISTVCMARRTCIKFSKSKCANSDGRQLLLLLLVNFVLAPVPFHSVPFSTISFFENPHLLFHCQHSFVERHCHDNFLKSGQTASDRRISEPILFSMASMYRVNEYACLVYDKCLNRTFLTIPPWNIN